MPTIFSDHNDIILEVSKRRASRSSNMWKLNDTLLRSHWVKEEIKREIKSDHKTNENKNTANQILCNPAKAFLRGKFLQYMHIW